MTGIDYDVTIDELQELIDTNIASNDFASSGNIIRITGGNAGEKLTSGATWRLNIFSFIGDYDVDSTLTTGSLTGGVFTKGALGDIIGGDGYEFLANWTLTINGESTGSISNFASAATIKTAIEALSSVGTGNIDVEYIDDAGAGIQVGVRITFKGDLANQATGFSISATASGFTLNEVKNWSGAAGTSEVQRISIAGSPGAGQFSIVKGTGFSQAIAYNQTASELEDILEAVSTIGAGKVSCSGGPFPDSFIDVAFTGSLGGTDVELMVKNQGAVETTAEGGEAATVEVTTVQSTIQHETTVESSGPNDFNTADNWDDEIVPVNGDDLLIPDGDSILYGLDQSDKTFTLQYTARETEMGLPRRNADGNIEYRARALKASFTEIIIDSNSQLINIDIMDSSPAIKVLNSGAGRNTPYAVSVIGENAANTATLLVLSGNVGVADGPKEAAYLKSITQRGGQIWVGPDVGLEDVERTGGQFHSDRTTIDGTITL
tara:strand:- start:635 stop:2110 length:1476 start_codon:yes stop_codon:yes gene_type:complete